MNDFIINHFDLFIILIISIICISSLAISLFAKVFKASNAGIKNSFSVLFLTSITFFLFYECFDGIFTFFGSKNNIFIYILPLIISFIVFVYVFQSKFSYYGKFWNIFEIFIFFLLIDIIFILFYFAVLRSLNLI